MAYSAAQADEIKVVSFNLRRDFGPQRKNRWETRKELAARLIEESNASIIGVQEFLPQMRRDLKGLLDGYSIFGRGRLSGKSRRATSTPTSSSRTRRWRSRAAAPSGSPKIRTFPAGRCSRSIRASARWRRFD